MKIYYFLLSIVITCFFMSCASLTLKDPSVTDRSDTSDCDINNEITKSAQEYVSKGEAFISAGNFDCAIIYYSKAIEIDPQFSTAYFCRGNAFYKKAKTKFWFKNEKYIDKAILDFNKTIALVPTHIDAYNNRGILWFMILEDEKAIQDYTKAIELNSNYERAYYHRALVWEYKKNYERAIKDYNTFLKIAGNKHGNEDFVKNKLVSLSKKR